MNTHNTRHQTNTIAVLLLVLIGAATSFACSDDAGEHDVDARTVDATAALSAITGTIIDRHVTGDGETLAPVNLSSEFDLELMTVDDSGAFTSYPGMGTADGEFAFADVPEQTTYLRYGIRYFHTDQRTFELGTGTSSRAGAQHTTQETRLNVAFDGLSPWAEGHELQMNTAGADLWLPIPAAHLPADGAITLDASIDVHAVGGAPILPSSTQGDDTWFTRLAPQTIPDSASTYSALIEALHVPVLDLQDGQPATIAGTFAPVPRDVNIDVDWRGTAFSNLSMQMLPDGTSVDVQSASLIAAAGHNPLSAQTKSASADLMYVTFAAPGEDIAFTADVGNPLPERWGELGLAVWSVRTTVDDGEGGTLVLSAAYIEQDAMSTMFGGPIQPRMTPPRDLRVEGLSADMMQTGLPESPEFTWSPPDQGVPSFYEIRVLELHTEGNALLARIRTEGTAIRIPPGLMDVGGRYAFEVRAWSAPNAPVAGPFGLVLGGPVVGRTTHIMAR